MIHRIAVLVLTATALAASGCDIFGSNDAELVTAGVYVVNQGNFGDGNGSLTVHDPVTGTTNRAAVSELNSTAQSLYMMGALGYLLLDTGNRIDVIDLLDNTRIGQITGLSNPRYMIAESQAKAYATSLYGDPETFSGGTVNVIDLVEGSVTRKIEVGDNPEGLAIVGNHLYVSNTGFGEGSTVSVINTSTDQVIDTIDLECDGPRMMFIDNQNELFVICNGKIVFDENWQPVGETDGQAVILNPATGAVIGRLTFDGRVGSTSFGLDVSFSRERNEAFLIQDQRIIRVNASSNSVAGHIDLPPGDPLGAVAFDEVSGLLYVSRVPGFTEAGYVESYSLDGTRVGRFDAGVAPSFISFRYSN